MAKLSEKFDMEKSSMEESIAKIRRQEKFNTIRNEKSQTASVNDTVNPEKKANHLGAVSEEYIIAYLICNPEMCQYINSKIRETDFITAFNRKVFAFVSGRISTGKSAELVFLSQQFSEEEVAYITAYVSENARKSFSREELDNCIGVLKKESNKKIRKNASELEDEDLREIYNNRLKNGV